MCRGILQFRGAQSAGHGARVLLRAGDKGQVPGGAAGVFGVSAALFVSLSAARHTRLVLAISALAVLSSAWRLFKGAAVKCPCSHASFRTYIQETFSHLARSGGCESACLIMFFPLLLPSQLYRPCSGPPADPAHTPSCRAATMSLAARWKAS